MIIIIAILAAIAIPTFLGQRNKANDAAAKSLVRNAMTAIESLYVDNRTFEDMAAADLMAIEPSITFQAGTLLGAATGADAGLNQVAYTGDDDDTYQVGTNSKSGTAFGVNVDKKAGGGNTFYKGGQALQQVPLGRPALRSMSLPAVVCGDRAGSCCGNGLGNGPA